MSDHGNNSGHESDFDTKKIGERAFYFLGALAVVLLLGFNLKSCSHGTPPPADPSSNRGGTQQSAQNPGATTSNGTQSATVAPGSICAPFSTDGATCNIGTEGSGWIRVAGNTPAGLHFCWTPNVASHKLKEIWYLGADGQKKLWDSKDPTQNDVQAYMFIPNESVTLSYDVAQKCT
jgi:hypothetical protein